MCEYIAIRSETQGTEPSKYLEEKTSTAGCEVGDEIPLVAASERGRAQTTRHACGVVGPSNCGVTNRIYSRTTLGRSAKEGESPVGEMDLAPLRVPE